MFAATSKATTSGGKDEKHMRDLLQRLCPEAVKACAGTALSVSFNQWVEQVLTTLIKQQQQQQQQQQVSSSHKSTQSNSLQNPSAPQNSHNNSNSANGSRRSSSSASNSPHVDNTLLSSISENELLKENSILRIRIDELTRLARKTVSIIFISILVRM